MQIEVSHTLGAADAQRRMERFVEALVARDWPGGVTVTKVERAWHGSRLDFSFALARAFFSAPVAGALTVGEASIVLDASLPPMLVAFVGEARLREVLSRELARALADP